MSEDNKLQYDGYYVSIWSDAESFVFRDGIVKTDKYLRFYEDSEVISATIKPLADEQLKDWITKKFSRWTKDDFEKNGQPEFYNVNDDPDHPYVIADYAIERKSRIKFEFKTFRDGNFVKWSYDGVIENNIIECMVESTGGKKHKEKFKFVPLADIKYTSKKESNLYRNFILHHFTRVFGGKPQKFQANIGLDKDLLHNELYFIPPSKNHPYNVIFTCGMGKNGMDVRLPELKYAELCIFLPPDWNIIHVTKYDLLYSQPFKSLLMLSRYPFKNWTYLANGDIVVRGDNPKGIDFIGGMLAKLSSTFEFSIGHDSIQIEERRINVYGVVHLYREELDFKNVHNFTELLESFQKSNINPFIFNPNRKNLFEGRNINIGKVGDKVEYILKRLNIHPKTLEEWHKLIDLLIDRKEFGNVYIMIIHVEELFPQDYLIYYKKAQLAFRTELIDVSVAQHSLEISTTLNPEFAPSWLALGNVYVDKKSWEKAIEPYTICTELDPQNSTAWKALSVPLVNTGRFAKALEILEEAEKLHPDDIAIKERIKEIKARLRI